MAAVSNTDRSLRGRAEIGDGEPADAAAHAVQDVSASHGCSHEH